MTEALDLKIVNQVTKNTVEQWLEASLDDTLAEEHFLGTIYGNLIAAYILGYDIEHFITYANEQGEKLLQTIKPKNCPNKDEKGNCPLHNLQCQYPDCEKD